MSQCRTVVKMKFYDYRVLVQENTQYFFRHKYIFNLYDKIKSNISKVIFFYSNVFNRSIYSICYAVK